MPESDGCSSRTLCPTGTSLVALPPKGCKLQRSRSAARVLGAGVPFTACSHLGLTLALQAGEAATPPRGEDLANIAQLANISPAQAERWFARRAALQRATPPAAGLQEVSTSISEVRYIGSACSIAEQQLRSSIMSRSSSRRRLIWLPSWMHLQKPLRHAAAASVSCASLIVLLTSRSSRSRCRCPRILLRKVPAARLTGMGSRHLLEKPSSRRLKRARPNGWWLRASPYRAWQRRCGTGLGVAMTAPSAGVRCPIRWTCRA